MALDVPGWHENPPPDPAGTRGVIVLLLVLGLLLAAGLATLYFVTQGLDVSACYLGDGSDPHDC